MLLLRDIWKFQRQRPCKKLLAKIQQMSQPTHHRMFSWLPRESWPFYLSISVLYVTFVETYAVLPGSAKDLQPTLSQPRKIFQWSKLVKEIPSIIFWDDCPRPMFYAGNVLRRASTPKVSAPLTLRVSPSNSYLNQVSLASDTRLTAMPWSMKRTEKRNSRRLRLSGQLRIRRDS